MKEQNYTIPDEAEDDHAHVRVYKLLEVAYRCAENEYYERGIKLAVEAAEHFEESFAEE